MGLLVGRTALYSATPGRIVFEGINGFGMWQEGLLGFFAGVFGANGVPHFVRGITRETYPCMLGNSPIPNLLGGWASFVISAILVYVYMAGTRQYPMIALICGAIGALLMGLFHAAGLAFGKKD